MIRLVSYYMEHGLLHDPEVSSGNYFSLLSLSCQLSSVVDSLG